MKTRLRIGVRLFVTALVMLLPELAGSAQQTGASARYDRLIQEARAHIKNGQLTDAERLTKDAIELDPKRWDAYAVLGTVYVTACQTPSPSPDCGDRMEFAASLFEAALASAPEASQPAIRQLLEAAHAIRVSLTKTARSAASLRGVSPKRIKSVDSLMSEAPVSCAFASGDLIACPHRQSRGDKAGGSVQLFSGRSGSLLREIGPRDWYYDAVATSKDGTRLATLTRGKPRNGWFSRELLVLDVATGNTLATVKNWMNEIRQTAEDAQSSFGKFGALAMSGDGRSVALAFGRTLLVYDVATSKKLFAVHADDTTTDVAFSPDDTRVAVSNKDNTIWIIDAKTGKTERRLQHRNVVASLSWAENVIVSLAESHVNDIGAGLGNLTLWNPSSGQALGSIHSAGVTVSASPNGQEFVVAGASTRLYHAASGFALAEWLDSEYCKYVRWNASGTQVLVGCTNVDDESASAWLVRLSDK